MKPWFPPSHAGTRDELGKGALMKYGAWIMLCGVAGVAALGLVGDTGLRFAWDVVPAALAGDPAKPSGAPGGLPPLKVDRQAPLLLGDAPATKPAKKLSAGAADNSPCLCCHTNYEEEPLAVTHANEDISCMDCHGKSFAHRNDEDNVTPPDVMFGLDKIDRKCQECHEEHDAPAKKVIARWQKRCPKKTDSNSLVCTDCHFQHRLKFRTVWWDKKTRKLIVRKQGERIKLRDDHKGKEGLPERPSEEMQRPAEEGIP